MLLIEAMAQTAGALCVNSRLGGAKPPLVYFMTIDKAKFRKPVVPGDRVEFHMTRINQRRNIWWYQGKAMVDGALVAEAEISAMIMSRRRLTSKADPCPFIPLRSSRTAPDWATASQSARSAISARM